ncbi:MAG: FGGY-family carbohydrate kinase [Terriglobia bacterium]
MSTSYLLGVDIGTYSSKGALVKETGELVATSTVEHALEIPHSGWAEHDAESTWWHDFLAITRELLHASGIQSTRIAGIGFSAISPAVLPIDHKGRPLRKAILYGIDTRATQEIAELQQIIDNHPVHRTSGIRISSQSSLPKILWIRRNEPEVWAKTHWVANGTGFLGYRLTGEVTLDVYDAVTFAPFVDYDHCSWKTAIEEHVVPVERLPRLTWTCDIAGKITAEAARLTGLAEGTPVITGTADAAAEAISAGLANAGDMMVMYGSSIFFILRTDRLLLTPSFWGAHFLEKGTHVLTGGMSTAGSLTKWFRDQFAPREVEAEKAGGNNAYAALAQLAASSPPGANGIVVLPYFSGERTPILDPNAKGMIFGLGLSHTRTDIYRALLESIGFGIRHNIEQMQMEGANPRRILAVGGGTLNPVLMRIVSDIIGLEQHIPEQQVGACYGDALLAGVGVGVFKGVTEATRQIKTKQVVTPDASAHHAYEGFYGIYRELYAATAPLMGRLSVLVGRG